MEYYSDINKNEILPLATTWMDVEDIKWNKQMEKDKRHMILLICGA